MTTNFRQDRVLGGGGFGNVYKGFISDYIREGLLQIQALPVAVKVHDGHTSHQGHREWLAEVIFLGQISHPILVKLIGYCSEDDYRVEFKEGVVQPPEIKSSIVLPLDIDIFGQIISLLPVQQSLNPLQELVANILRTISGQPPFKIPIPGERSSSWLLTTYLDEDLRISR